MMDHGLTDETVIANGAYAARAATPRLSILTPCYRYDVGALIRAFASQTGLNDHDVEFILFDDGSNDAQQNDSHRAAMAALPWPALLVTSARNPGRAGARNRLSAHARARHWLMLDADMIPDRDDFVRTWLDEIAAHDPAVTFGGFSVAQAPDAPATALHKHLTARSDCHPAAVRTRTPASSLATSNLLIRADILSQTPFDEGFSGWGWEDVEWALRVSRLAAIRHIDNQATHAGLDTIDTLVRKFREAGPNYARLCAAHPEAVRAFPSFRAARVFRAIPAHGALRPFFEMCARSTSLPLPIRALALKLFRTSIYADHLP
jgi:glycosyltransferase involved in cell wall biosynthesis